MAKILIFHQILVTLVDRNEPTIPFVTECLLWKPATAAAVAAPNIHYLLGTFVQPIFDLFPWQLKNHGQLYLGWPEQTKGNDTSSMNKVFTKVFQLKWAVSGLFFNRDDGKKCWFSGVDDQKKQFIVASELKKDEKMIRKRRKNKKESEFGPFKEWSVRAI